MRKAEKASRNRFVVASFPKITGNLAGSGLALASGWASVGAYRGDEIPHLLRRLQARMHLDASRPAPTGIQGCLGQKVVGLGNPGWHLHPEDRRGLHQETGLVERLPAGVPAEFDPFQPGGKAWPGAGGPVASEGFGLPSGSRQIPVSQKGSIQGREPGIKDGVGMVFGGRRTRVQQCRRLPGNGLQPMGAGRVRRGSPSQR